MSSTTNLINVGDLYITLDVGRIVAYKNDDPYRSEFRMKPGYVFTVVETDIRHKPHSFVRVLMSNTGKFQLLNLEEFVAYLSYKNAIKKIG